MLGKPNKTYLSVDPRRGYPAGSDIRYECGLCGDTLPSMLDHSAACKCRNVIIDVDAGRIAVKDHSHFKAFVANAASER